MCYYYLMPNTKFKNNHRPWNKDIKGIHLSPETEFKAGVRGVRWVAVGSVKIRMYHGKMRACQKVAEPNTWRLRSQVVWESVNGQLPKGYTIHHKDRDVSNDDISNLELLSRGEHLQEHRAENEANRRKGLLNMKRSDILCVDCGGKFKATKKAKYCATCKRIRVRNNKLRYKAKIKINSPA